MFLNQCKLCSIYSVILVFLQTADEIKNSSSCEMDMKIQIKEEDPLSDDIASQNERELFSNNVTMNANSDTVLLDNDFDVAFKTEIKSETTSPGFCSQKERECFIKHPIEQIKSETVTCSNNCEIDTKTEIEEHILISDFGPQNREFLREDPIMKDKYNSDLEIDNKIEIKEESWWLETKTSLVCDDIKDGEFPPVKSRLCTEEVSGDSSCKSPLPFAEVPRSNISFYNGNDHLECEGQECHIQEVATVKEDLHSEGKCSDGEIYNMALYLKQKYLIHRGEKPHKCNICEKSFTYVSHLKRHELIHRSERPHRCKTCKKSFTQLSHLKRHNLVHKSHHFTLLSNSKRHNLIHEGKKSHQCKTCDKNFTWLSHLKIHNLIHEGKKPHQCKICDKSFTQLSHLKSHNLIHEGKKPHQCKTCDKSFTQLSDLKIHNLIHEGKKPHQCKTCDKSFTQLSHLKRHNLIHEGKKPYQCKACDKSFTDLSNLKRHILVHKGKKTY